MQPIGAAGSRAFQRLALVATCVVVILVKGMQAASSDEVPVASFLIALVAAAVLAWAAFTAKPWIVLIIGVAVLVSQASVWAVSDPLMIPFGPSLCWAAALAAPLRSSARWVIRGLVIIAAGYYVVALAIIVDSPGAAERALQSPLDLATWIGGAVALAVSWLASHRALEIPRTATPAAN